MQFENRCVSYNEMNIALLLFQVPIGGQSVHYVSYKRNAFYPMKLPKYTLPKVRLLEAVFAKEQEAVTPYSNFTVKYRFY